MTNPCSVMMEQGLVWLRTYVLNQANLNVYRRPCPTGPYSENINNLRLIRASINLTSINLASMDDTTLRLILLLDYALL